MKQIFKTKEQEHDFMISFEGMPKNFKGTCPSARCTIDCTEHFYQRSSPFNPNFSLFKLKAPCYIWNNLSSNFYQQFMVRTYCSPNLFTKLSTFGKMIAL